MALGVVGAIEALVAALREAIVRPTAGRQRRPRRPWSGPLGIAFSDRAKSQTIFSGSMDVVGIEGDDRVCAEFDESNRTATPWILAGGRRTSIG